VIRTLSNHLKQVSKIKIRYHQVKLKNNFYILGNMASTHSPYRASSPGRKFSDYLSEAKNIMGQDTFSNQYR